MKTDLDTKVNNVVFIVRVERVFKSVWSKPVY